MSRAPSAIDALLDAAGVSFDAWLPHARYALAGWLAYQVRYAREVFDGEDLDAPAFREKRLDEVRWRAEWAKEQALARLMLEWAMAWLDAQIDRLDAARLPELITPPPRGARLSALARRLDLEEGLLFEEAVELSVEALDEIDAWRVGDLLREGELEARRRHRDAQRRALS